MDLSFEIDINLEGDSKYTGDPFSIVKEIETNKILAEELKCHYDAIPVSELSFVCLIPFKWFVYLNRFRNKILPNVPGPIPFDNFDNGLGSKISSVGEYYDNPEDLSDNDAGVFSYENASKMMRRYGFTGSPAYFLTTNSGKIVKGPIDLDVHLSLLCVKVCSGNVTSERMLYDHFLGLSGHGLALVSMVSCTIWKPFLAKGVFGRILVKMRDDTTILKLLSDFLVKHDFHYEDDELIKILEEVEKEAITA